MHNNINKIPADGYIVIPISMARVMTGQSPDVCYEMVSYFEPRLTTWSVDVVFLYTNGLYYNVDDTALNVRRTTNQLMIEHKNQLSAIIKKQRKYVTPAFHYLPWDYVLLNGQNFSDQLIKLKRHYSKSPLMQTCLQYDLNQKELHEANVDFILEEVVATHLVRQKLIELPKTLVRRDAFRLMVSPGPYIQTDVYQFEHKILDLNPELTRDDYPYASGHYDYEAKTFYDYRVLAEATRQDNIINLSFASSTKKG